MATVIVQKRKREKFTSYIVYFKDPFTTQRMYYQTFRLQKDAQIAANELRALLDSGKIPGKQRNKIRPMTFDEVANTIQESWRLKIKTSELREKTVEDYIYTLDQLRKVFGGKLLCKITPEEIERYRAEQAATYSNVSANKKLAVIKKVFRLATDLKGINDNRIEEIKMLSEKSHMRNRFLRPRDLTRLLEASSKVKAAYLTAIILLAAEHGASKQEILSLTWDDIDFDFNGIGLIRFFRHKNGKERTAFLMPRTKDALTAWKRHQQVIRKRKKIFSGVSNLVFSHHNGQTIKCFNKAWWTACDLAELQNLHFHDMRHTFASNLILSGAGLKEVKEMIGHSDIGMTDRYAHLTAMHKLKHQQELAQFYAAEAGQ